MGLKIYRTSEEHLIKGCLRGDRASQKSLYEQYAPKMYSLCFRYVKNHMVAQDLLVTSFMKVFEKIGQFKNEGSFEGWIRRIMVNESLTHLRKQRMMYIETDLEVADRQPDYQSLGDALEAEDLLKMIAELPAGYRIVFNMYAIDGYSHKEIAEHLGISESTSKSQLCRARVYLQNMLHQEEWSYDKTLTSDEAAT
jgi:RNA polymerase sigma factor (sigma-70 family)